MTRPNPAQHAEPLQITQPAILFRLTRTYRPGITPQELYDATRGKWSINPDRASRAVLAYATHQGKVLQVYRIHHWSDSDETWGRARYPRRWFTGSIAEDYQHHIGRDVSHYWTPRASNNFTYLNCDPASRPT